VGEYALLVMVDGTMRWIGPHYQAGFAGRRLIVVVEAHPREAEGFRVGRGLEAVLVPGYLDESVKHRQLTDLARMVLGHVAERQECVEFYQSVALVNIPEAACAAGRLANEPEWSGVGQELSAVVQELKPECVLVLGERLAEEVRTKWPAEQARIEQTQTIGRAPELCYAAHPAARSFAFRDQWNVTRQLRAP